MATAKKKESSKILLIDDDPLIRDLSSEYLESNGLSVITAANGLEGLKLYQEHCEEISLVVLDLVMPQMSGRDCWLRLREIDPQVRVLVTTGGSLNKELRICLKEGVLGYLTKPFRPSQLLNRLRENL